MAGAGNQFNEGDGVQAHDIQSAARGTAFIITMSFKLQPMARVRGRTSSILSPEGRPSEVHIMLATRSASALFIWTYLLCAATQSNGAAQAGTAAPANP